MKKSIYCTMLFLSLLLISCSPSKTLLQKEYAQKRINNGSLGIVVIDQDPYVDYRGSLKRSLGEGESKQLIFDYFKKQLTDDIQKKTYLNPVTVIEGKTGFIIFTSREITFWKEGGLFMSKSKRNVKVPPKGHKFIFNGFEPDYVLILDSLSILDGRESGSGIYTNEVQLPSIPNKTLTYSSDFVIWHNVNADLISYGHIEETTSKFVFLPNTMSDWKAVSSSFVNTVFLKSPFKK